jgi:hypothetical protein
MITYKIVEKVDTNKYKYLFHERKNMFTNGSILIAKKKMVYESYDKKTNKKKIYLSGIHVIQTEELCRKYLNRFKDKSNKTIIMCNATDWHKKPRGNPGVLLANKVKIIGEI